MVHVLRAAIVAAVVAGGLAAVAGGLVVGAGSAPASAAVTAPGGYVSVAPARLLDTRDGTGRRAARSPRTVSSPCRSPAAAACPPASPPSP